MFDKDVYLAKFQGLDALFNERNRIHRKYYLNQDYMKSCSEDTLVKVKNKMRALGSEFAKLRSLSPTNEDQDSDEWRKAFGCPITSRSATERLTV